jgi:hypothetical protein
MSDIKTEAETALNDVKAEISKLKADEVSASGWVKTHVVWMVALGALLIGLIAGHFIK